MALCGPFLAILGIKKSGPILPPETRASGAEAPPSANVSETPTANLPAGESPPKDHVPREPSVLWNDAYEAVVSDDVALAKAYEDVLVRIDSESPQRLLPPVSDSRPRLEKLEDAVRKGVKRTERWQEARDSVGDILDAVRSANNIISNALSAVPQAAAAWTGMMLVFEVRTCVFKAWRDAIADHGRASQTLPCNQR
jgi:hypothetical protein